MITVTVDADLVDIPPEIIDQAIIETAEIYQDEILSRATRLNALFGEYVEANSVRVNNQLRLPSGLVNPAKVISQRVAKAQARRRVPRRIEQHTRRTPSGRTTTVRTHVRRHQPPMEFLKTPLPGQIWIRKGGTPPYIPFTYDGSEPVVDITPAILRLIDNANSTL